MLGLIFHWVQHVVSQLIQQIRREKRPGKSQGWKGVMTFLLPKKSCIQFCAARNPHIPSNDRRSSKGSERTLLHCTFCELFSSALFLANPVDSGAQKNLTFTANLEQVIQLHFNVLYIPSFAPSSFALACLLRLNFVPPYSAVIYLRFYEQRMYFNLNKFALISLHALKMNNDVNSFITIS